MYESISPQAVRPLGATPQGTVGDAEVAPLGDERPQTSEQTGSSRSGAHPTQASPPTSRL